MEPTDQEFLMWIHERLEHHYGDSRLTSHMHRLRQIIWNQGLTKVSTRNYSSNSLEKLQKDLAPLLPSQRQLTPRPH